MQRAHPKLLSITLVDSILRRARHAMQAASLGVAVAGLTGAAVVFGGGPSAFAGSAHQHSSSAPASSAGTIVRDPSDLPGPIGGRGPQRVHVDLETVEVVGRLNDHATYHYWTFNGKVPGPFIRVRVGDTVEVHLKNADNSTMLHNVDFHAVIGMHGGGHATVAQPGETKSFTFKALNPGLFVYHCATPMVAMHVANGMYGMILVEPAGGLPKVDREFYVMQGEIYTEQAFGAKGELTQSVEKLLDERPDYFVLNGAVGGLVKTPLKAKVGETVRIYFGVGGPNFTSSFHVIGEIFDRAYAWGSLTSKPRTAVQTISVPPGGATVVEMKLESPGQYPIVDHALARVERGLLGILQVDGPENPSVFHEGVDTRVGQLGK